MCRRHLPLVVRRRLARPRGRVDGTLGQESVDVPRLDSAETESASLCAMAFGPGLTVETAVMERIGTTAMKAPQLGSVSHA